MFLYVYMLPLLFKAMMTKKSKDLDITFLLVNFHTQMSFLSAIGYVVQNSGIKQILSLAFAEHSAEKMLSGRRYARAMKAHDLLYTVLKIILFDQIDDSSVTQHASGMYDLYTSNQSFGHLNFDQNNDTIDLILDEVEKVKVKLSGTERNRFWLIYREMVEILCINLMAERCGLWDLYLSTLSQMLPYFAGIGRNNYTRSVYWFLQEMVYLDEEISVEFRKGYFAERGTDNFWSGVSPDLCIEQTPLMAGLKGATELTRGRGLTEQNPLIWVLSRPTVVLIDSNILYLLCLISNTLPQLEQSSLHPSTVLHHRHLLHTICYNHRLLLLHLLISRKEKNKQQQASRGLRSQKGLRPFNPLQN